MQSYWSDFKCLIWELGFLTIFYYCIVFIMIFIIASILLSSVEVSIPECKK